MRSNFQVFYFIYWSLEGYSKLNKILLKKFQSVDIQIFEFNSEI